MRAAGVTALGGSVEILELDEVAQPAADEVVIEVVAAGIGNWDDLVRIGSWQIGGPAPMALGTSAAGIVAAVGSDVANVSAGDEVLTHPLPLRRHGTWAERLLAPAAAVAPRPQAACWEAAGAFPIPALTAAQALDEALEIESGDWVVVNGAGGITGGLLVQLAAARGARVIATASPKKAARMRSYGASEVLDYHDDWPTRVLEITGGGAPAAVNAAPGQTLTTLQAVAEGGPPRNDHGRPAARGTGHRRIRRLRPARRSAAVGNGGTAEPRRAQRADRVRPPARRGGTSAARGRRGSRRCDRPLTQNVARPEKARPKSHGVMSHSMGRKRDRTSRRARVSRQSFPVGTTVAGSTMSTRVRPRACGRCTMPRGIVTP